MGSATLEIRLFGELELRRGGLPLPPFDSARAESLLAYLVMHRDAPQPRQRIAYLLWPDSSERQARTNLRHVLYKLRRAFPDAEALLDVTPRTLQWKRDASAWLDVAAFEEALSRAEVEESDQALGALREAVDLYTGDLLEGVYVEWLLAERERLRSCYQQALERLVVLLQARSDYAQAIGFAENLVRLDPLREEPYRLLMRLHNGRGDRARALRVFHECAAILEGELGVDPSPATREIYEALLPVDQASPVAGRPASRLGGPPLVGRASEWEQLTTLWRATESGRNQLAIVSGEAGIGKTRLVEEFRSWCVHRGAIAAESRSYRAEGTPAYGPIIAWLRSEALGARLPRLDRAFLVELTRLLPELLAEIPGLSQPEPLPEIEQRQRLFDAVARAILVPGEPLLLVADDLHWGDRETLQVLHYLLRLDPHARLLVVATVRREELDPGHPLSDLIAGMQSLDRVTEIEIGRLGREETALLAGRLIEQPLSGPDLELLYRETAGNPLFIVETVRAGWRHGRDPSGELSPKVQAVIESRLAQLSEPARDLVGVAAVSGGEFSSDLLMRAGEANEGALVRALDELWRRRIVRERGADSYDFSHDRIREVAYLALSPARRRHLHLRVARALEHMYAYDPEQVSGQLAAHYERAGHPDQAVEWYQRAAGIMQQLHAHSDSIRLLERALSLLSGLPQTPERQARELAILTALPAPLVAVEGYLSKRVTEIHERALDLTRAFGIEPDSPLLRSLALAGLSRYEFKMARRFGEQLHRYGAREGDDVLLVQSEYVLGIAAFWRGELEAARGFFEAAVGRFRPEHRREHFLHYGHDPESTCLIRLACTLWLLGYPDTAIRTRDTALDSVEAIGHPYSRTLTLVFAALLALEMRDPDRLRAYTAELRAGRTDEVAVHVRATAEVFSGCIDVLDGWSESGIARIQHILHDSGISEQAPGQTAFFLRVLLEACLVAGDARAGLVAADHLLQANRGVRLWESDAHRLRASFLAALGAHTSDVEAEIQRALGAARRQRARSPELRAATALLRHLLHCGDGQRTQAARDLLSATVDALPERSDVPDLREAESLLATS